MKKSLLTIASLALSIGAFAQATPSPFWNTIQNSNFPQPQAGVRFLDAVDANNVWMIGYDGLAPNRTYNWYSVSNNGGTSFTSGNVYSDTNSYVLANMEGISATTAWVSAYTKSIQSQGAVHSTTNAGLTWTNMTPAGGYTNGGSFVNLVTFLTPSVGIIQGDPIGSPLEFEIYRTTDGGATWSQIPGSSIANPQSSAEYGLVDVYTKYGTNDIWFGTTTGRVYHSSDAGLTWTAATVPGAVVGISELAFTDSQNGLCYAFSGSQASPVFGIYRTTDGGATWTQISPVDPNLGRNDVVAITGTSWFASCGAGTGNQIISYSSDHGATWNSWGGSNIQYLTMDFVSNSIGWAGSFSSTIAVQGGLFKYSGQPLSVGEVSNAPRSMDVYPNPTSGMVTINLPVAKQGCDINVINALGQTVYSTKATAVTTGETLNMNLSNLDKGIYFVSVVNGHDKYTKKIVIN